MKTLRITAMARAEHEDLIRRLEQPLENPCPVLLGTEWICQEAAMPRGFCPSAWPSLYPYVFALANGAEILFDGWMKEKGCALVSCSDGFRPVSFLIEPLEET